MEKFKNKSLKYKIAAAALAIAMIVPSFTPAQAIGFGVPTSINWQEFLLELAKQVVISSLNAVTDHYVGTAVNKALSQYKIANVLNYTSNLANQVYVGSTMNNMHSSLTDQYIYRSIISDAQHLPVAHQNLSPLYTKAALGAYSLFQANSAQPGSDLYLSMANLSNPSSDPVMVAMNYQQQASYVSNVARTSAIQDISGNNNKKSTYGCNLATATGLQPGSGDGSGSGGGVSGISQDVACATAYPGSYIDSLLNNQLNSVFQRDAKPQDDTSAIARAIGDTITKSLFNSIFGTGTGGSLISDVNLSALASAYNSRTVDQSYDFGNVPVGQTQSHEIIYTNNYNPSGSSSSNGQSITITNVSMDIQNSDVAFSIGDEDCDTNSSSLTAGDTCYIDVDFAPTSAGQYNGVIDINFDDANGSSHTETIDLSGKGAASGTNVTFQVFTASGQLLGDASQGGQFSVSAGTPIVFKWDAGNLANAASVRLTSAASGLNINDNNLTDQKAFSFNKSDSFTLTVFDQNGQPIKTATVSGTTQ